MGYTARTVDAEGVKKTLTECVPICDIIKWDTTATSYETIFKLTVDMTDVDYLNYRYTINSSAGGDTDFRIRFGTTDKVTDSVTNTSKSVNGSIDCTAVSGDQTITVQIQKDAGASGNYCSNVQLWTMEA